MHIVIDSNTLFSALIKDSITRKLILEYDGLFLFPSFIFEEAKKHKGELLIKSGMNEQEFNELLDIILRKVILVPSETLYLYYKEALEIAKKIDIDDTTFFACALAYPGSIIWSNDRNLKNQTKVQILNTSEIKRFYRKSGV